MEVVPEVGLLQMSLVTMVGDEFVFASVCDTVAGCCVGGAGVCNTGGCINGNCAVEVVADLLVHLRLFLLVVVVVLVVGKVSLLKRFFLPSKSYPNFRIGFGLISLGLPSTK